MKTIRSKLFTVYGAFALLSVGGIALVLTLFGQHLTRKSMDQALDSAVQQLQTRISFGEDMMSSLAESIARQPHLTEAFARRDREALRKQTVPIFQRLEKLAGVKQFQFHLPPATSFFRAHRPNKFGDDLSSFRHTVVAANTTHERVIGLEKGRAGYGVRAVVPVSYQGRYIGTVEMGQALEPLIRRLGETAGIKIALFEITPRGLARASFNSFGSEVSAARTAFYLGDKSHARLIDSDLVDKNYAVDLITLKNYRGQPTMVAMLGVDKAGVGADGRLIVWLALGLTGSVGTALWTVAFLSTNFIVLNLSIAPMTRWARLYVGMMTDTKGFLAAIREPSP